MRHPRLWLAPLVLLYVAAHLPFVATTLEDIDSVNFALGIRHFDPSLHRPHPPGYPLFIAVQKSVTALLAPASLGAAEAATMSLLAVFSGALAAVPLFVIFRTLEGSWRRPSPEADIHAVTAVLLASAWPLAWFTAVRPMSDTIGLTVALAAQACLATAFTRRVAPRPEAAPALAGIVARVALEGVADVEGGTAPAGPREAPAGRTVRRSADPRDLLIVAGALLTGLGAGFRSQAAWLTVPVLLLALVGRRGPGALRARLQATLALVVGVVVWAVPLIVASGGWHAYVAALGGQGGEDLAGVEMLATQPGTRLLALAFWRTLVLPVGPESFGVVLVGLAALGGLRLLRRAPQAVLLLAVLVGPYFAYHLLWQETVTTRYALPIVPPLAYMVVAAVSTVQRGWLMALPLAAACLAIAVPATRAYAAGSPTSTILRELLAARATHPHTVLGLHFVFARPLQAEAPGVPHLPTPNGREWLALVSHWREGGGPAWFLADPVRTDLALIDPASRLVRRRASWPRAAERLLHGVRPSAIEWVEIVPPGWMLGEGWSLTPQTAGRAKFDGRGLQAGTIEGFLRVRQTPVTLVLGGRHLGATGDPPGRLVARIGADVVDRWETAPGAFLRVIERPSIAPDGPGPYARLTVELEPAGGRQRPPIALEQFDAQAPASRPLLAYDGGWNELEYDPKLRRLFRWGTRASTLRVLGGDEDLVLTLAGESPARYFDRPVRLTVRAGATPLGVFTLDDDFVLRVRVPAPALREANGRVLIEADRTFTPAARGDSADHRQLGLRFFRIGVAHAN